MTRMKPETVAAKALGEVDEATGAIVPPIHLATTYARDAAYQLIDDRDYARDKNPTFLHAERLLAALEGGAAAMTFASGL
jgi:cystathionine gamma-synthase